MALGLEGQLAGRGNLTPMQIAQNSLFTAREKLDLLGQMRADAAGAEAEGDAFGFSSAEIAAAIAHVRRGVEDGGRSKTVFKGGS
ncbi:hypothetical protein [Devosia sp.]|uniref:hypothetical protein n=1 Tax=Devosia sp. TaxID=1871048 RepID=UPI001ACE1E6D|nr:hypothetical protein [Devosia sp.]MBN9335012.1 hypothetical protein [Devosia sp.]